MAVRAGRLGEPLDRDAEVGAIVDALVRAQAREGGVLVLRGPAGIGKSIDPILPRAVGL